MTAKVPTLGQFSDQDTLHGGIVLELQKEHKCTEHLGEHGQPGYCYKPEGGDHIALNFHRFKVWAAAIVCFCFEFYCELYSRSIPFQAAHETSKYIPPNHAAFDGARDGRLNPKRPRGRTGPRPALPAEASAPDSQAGLMPLLTTLLTQQVLERLNPTATNQNDKTPPSTPKKRRNTTSHHPISPCPKRPRPQLPIRPTSPLPDPANELHSFLLALRKARTIDLLAYEKALSDLEFTPDILPEVSALRLVQIFGGTEGRALKVRAYANVWYEELTEKRRLVALAAGENGM